MDMNADSLEQAMDQGLDDYLLQQQQQQQQQTWGPLDGSCPAEVPQGPPQKSDPSRMPFKPPMAQQNAPVATICACSIELS